jgi:DNA-binding transcriptional regulator YiaG
MTPEALRALLSRLGLTQGQGARLCGVDARTMRRWVCGEREMPGPAERLLRAAEEVPGVLAWLLDQSSAAAL